MVPLHTNTPFGAVDLYTAVIDPAKADVMHQDEWFATRAPKPWRPIYASRA
jgi:hypothetical protein